MSNFRSIDRYTAYLLSPSVDDWLPPGPFGTFYRRKWTWILRKNVITKGLEDFLPTALL
jgi:hypothetical protein